jgi:hypothetical protein
MRTLLLSLFGLLLFQTIAAQSSGIKISYYDSTLITLQLGETEYNEPSVSFEINQIPAGDHKLKVFKLMQVGQSRIKQPVYDGVVSLPPNTVKFFVINRFNQLIDMGSTITNQTAQSNEINRNRRFKPDPQRIDSRTADYTSTFAMSNNQWQQQLDIIRSLRTENDRFITARQLLPLYTINSNQLAELMLLMQNENHRIELASIGFDYVTDRQNFGVVYNALRTPRSIHRLDRRLRGRI